MALKIEFGIENKTWPEKETLALKYLYLKKLYWQTNNRHRKEFHWKIKHKHYFILSSFICWYIFQWKSSEFFKITLLYFLITQFQLCHCLCMEMVGENRVAYLRETSQFLAGGLLRNFTHSHNMLWFHLKLPNGKYVESVPLCCCFFT